MTSHIDPSANALAGALVIPTSGLTYGPYDEKDFSRSHQVQVTGTTANGDQGAITWSPAPRTRYFVEFSLQDGRSLRWEFTTANLRNAELALIKTALTT